MAQLKAGEADGPHGEDKTDGAPDTNRREIGHDIHIRRLQAVVRNGVNQPQRWHIGQRVEQDDEEHLARRGDLGGEPQRQRADQMANGINPLGADPFIGNDTEQRRHKHRGDTERAIHRPDGRAVELEGDEHIRAERGEPASPEAELQERQYFELQLKIHVLILTDIELFCVLNNIYGVILVGFYHLCDGCFC